MFLFCFFKIFMGVSTQIIMWKFISLSGIKATKKIESVREN